MPDADWTLSVPTRHVDPDGTAIVVVEVTDAVTGESGTVTVTLTSGRSLQCLSEGLTLSDYQAWSSGP